MIIKRGWLFLKTIANIIWFLLIGLWSALGYAFCGLVFCITIIGIPFGLQLFKFAKLVLTPFGKTVNTNFGSHPIANLIWLFLGGIVNWFVFLLAGLILCITIIGIPLGKQAFKMGKLCLAPFGATIN